MSFRVIQVSLNFLCFLDLQSVTLFSIKFSYSAAKISSMTETVLLIPVCLVRNNLK